MFKRLTSVTISKVEKSAISCTGGRNSSKSPSSPVPEPQSAGVPPETGRLCSRGARGRNPSIGHPLRRRKPPGKPRESRGIAADWPIPRGCPLSVCICICIYAYTQRMCICSFPPKKCVYAVLCICSLRKILGCVYAV